MTSSSDITETTETPEAKRSKFCAAPESELSSELAVVIEAPQAKRSKFSVVFETTAAKRLTRCAADEEKSCRSPVKEADIDVDALMQQALTVSPVVSKDYRNTFHMSDKRVMKRPAANVRGEEDVSCSIDKLVGSHLEVTDDWHTVRERVRFVYDPTERMHLTRLGQMSAEQISLEARADGKAGVQLWKRLQGPKITGSICSLRFLCRCVSTKF